MERSRKNKEAVTHGEGRRKRMSGRKLGDGRAKTTRRVRQDGERGSTLQLPLEICPLKIECRARLFGAPWKREEVCRDLPSSKTFGRIYTTTNLKTYLRTERALCVVRNRLWVSCCCSLACQSEARSSKNKTRLQEPIPVATSLGESRCSRITLIMGHTGKKRDDAKPTTSLKQRTERTSVAQCTQPPCVARCG